MDTVAYDEYEYVASKGHYVRLYDSKNALVQMLLITSSKFIFSVNARLTNVKIPDVLLRGCT